MTFSFATLARTLLIAVAMTAPASALDNPVVVNVKAANAAASATLFERGNIVLVNITGEHGIPKDAAVTLNGGGCDKPGEVAFALTAFSENQSLTKMSNSLSEITQKAKSMVVHQTASATSPAVACGSVKG